MTGRRRASGHGSHARGGHPEVITMTVPHTATSVIGGGATGAGVLRDLARRGLRGAARRARRLRHRDHRPLPRPPPLRRPLRPEGPDRGPRVHRARTGCCGASRRPRSRTPAATSSRRPTTPTTTSRRSRTTARHSGVRLRGGRRSRTLLAQRAGAQPPDPPRVPRPGRLHRAVAAHRGDRSPTRGSTAPRPLSYQRVIGFEVSGGRIVAATLRDERDGTRDQGLDAVRRLARRARGRARSPRSPASRSR